MTLLFTSTFWSSGGAAGENSPEPKRGGVDEERVSSMMEGGRLKIDR